VYLCNIHVLINV